jgi:hypothetical protein
MMSVRYTWKFFAVALLGYLVLPLSIYSSYAAPSDPLPRSGVLQIRGQFFVDNKIKPIADGVSAQRLIEAVLPRVNSHLEELGFALSSQSAAVVALSTPDLAATLREISQIPTGSPDVFNIAIASEAGNGKFGLAIPAVACKNGVNSALVAVYRGLTDQALETLAITIAHELTHVLGAHAHSVDRQYGLPNIMFPYSVTTTFGYSGETIQAVNAYLATVQPCLENFSVSVAQLGTPATLSDSSPFEVFNRGRKQAKYRFIASDVGGSPSVSCSNNRSGKVSVRIKKLSGQRTEVQISGRHRKKDTKLGVVSCDIRSNSGVVTNKTIVF